MDNAFCIALYGKHNQYSCLELPATYYQLQDAMDKLQMAPGEKSDLELLHSGAFPFLHDHLGSDCDLYQLNTLLTRLEGLSDVEKAAFEGLVQMEAAKGHGPIPLHPAGSGLQHGLLSCGGCRYRSSTGQILR